MMVLGFDGVGFMAVAEGHRDSDGLKKGGGHAPRPLSSAAAMDIKPRRASSVRRGEVTSDHAVILQVACLPGGVGAKLHLLDALDALDRHAVLVAVVEVLLPRLPAFGKGGAYHWGSAT